MAKVTPAYVTYTDDKGVSQTLDFDAIIAEDHTASAQVTKYPVQTGYHVSNNSIRQNRSVGLEGVISNVRINRSERNSDGTLSETGESSKYGVDAGSAVKLIIEWLISTGQQCQVITNLGIYDPVVFTKFKTKQQAGLVDSMKFSLVGEEIIIEEELSYTAPQELAFVPFVSGSPEEIAIITELQGYGYHTDCMFISKTSYRVGEDYVLVDLDAAGERVETTYIYKGVNPASGEPEYEIHVGANSLLQHATTTTAAEDACAEAGFKDSTKGGFMETKTGQFLGNVLDIVTEAAIPIVDSALGELQSSARGAIYGITSNPVGSAIINAGVGTVIRTTTTSGGFEGTDYTPAESLPSATDMSNLTFVKRATQAPETEEVTVIIMHCNCTDGGGGAVDTSLLPA